MSSYRSGLLRMTSSDKAEFMSNQSFVRAEVKVMIFDDSYLEQTISLNPAENPASERSIKNFW